MKNDTILKEYMKSMNCEWKDNELRAKIKDSNGFKLHLACDRFNKSIMKLWDSVPWWKKILIRIECKIKR